VLWGAPLGMAGQRRTLQQEETVQFPATSLNRIGPVPPAVLAGPPGEPGNAAEWLRPPGAKLAVELVGRLQASERCFGSPLLYALGQGGEWESTSLIAVDTDRCRAGIGEPADPGLAVFPNFFMLPEGIQMAVDLRLDRVLVVQPWLHHSGRSARAGSTAGAVWGPFNSPSLQVSSSGGCSP